MQNSSALRCVLCGLVLSLCVPTDSRAELPVAPQPRAAKTKADRLIGRWQLVEVDNQKIAETSTVTDEYRADGTFFTLIRTKKGASAINGTFNVIGDTLHCHTFADQRGKEKKWQVNITSVNETEAILVQVSEKEKWVWKVNRLP